MTMRKLACYWLAACSMLFGGVAVAALDSQLAPKNVAVIVNAQNPNSVEIGQYYLKARNIPEKNLISIDLPNQATLTAKQFSSIKAQIDEKLGDDIKVLALVWSRPYAVECNSITAAMTLGYDDEQCKHTCDAGSKKNPYFDSNSLDPKHDFDMRLSILIPTDSIEMAKALIDRGMLTGFNLPQSTGYFLRTSDAPRSKPREPFFPKDFFRVDSRKIIFRNIRQDDIKHKKDVMFYITGLARVQHLETLNFMPGAIADHLTSFGGALDNQGQMPVTAWLEAGATGSYGTVTEPCNYWQKFSNPEVLVKYYLAGNTLIEAYWKSVYWPAQGLFVGEPLAAPYKGIQ